MPFTYPQKLKIIMAQVPCECPGLVEFGIECGRRIMNPSEAQFDARIADCIKLEDQDCHPLEEARMICTVCHKIKTARDLKAKAKADRLHGKSKRKTRKLRGRNFSKPRNAKYDWSTARYVRER